MNSLILVLLSVLSLMVTLGSANNCTSPQAIAGSSYSESFFLPQNALAPMFSSCNVSTAENSHFFCFTPSISGNFSIDAFGSFVSFISVFSGCGSCLPNEVACGIDFVDFVDLNLGNPYTIIVSGTNSSQFGNVSFSINPTVSNSTLNSCDAPEDIAGDSLYAGFISPQNSSAVIMPSACETGNFTNPYYFCYRPASNGSFSLSSIYSGYDQYISIYSGCDSCALSEIDCALSELSTSLVGGNFYTVAIYATDLLDYGFGSLDILPNTTENSCSNGLELSGDAFASVEVFQNASKPAMNSTCAPSGGHNPYYFCYTPLEDGYHNISTLGTAYNASITVYSSCNCGASELNCTDVPSIMPQYLLSGNSYGIMVAGTNTTSAGMLDIEILPADSNPYRPSNDEFVNATVYVPSTNTISFVVDTVNATNSLYPFDCPMTRDVFYCVGTQDIDSFTVEMDLIAPNFATLEMAVYQNCDYNDNQTLITTCNSHFADPTSPSISEKIRAGDHAQYLIRVGGDTTQFRLSITGTVYTSSATTLSILCALFFIFFLF